MITQSEQTTKKKINYNWLYYALLFGESKEETFMRRMKNKNHVNQPRFYDEAVKPVLQLQKKMFLRLRLIAKTKLAWLWPLGAVFIRARDGKTRLSQSGE